METWGYHSLIPLNGVGRKGGMNTSYVEALACFPPAQKWDEIQWLKTTPYCCTMLVLAERNEEVWHQGLNEGYILVDKEYRRLMYNDEERNLQWTSNRLVREGEELRRQSTQLRNAILKHETVSLGRKTCTVRTEQRNTGFRVVYVTCNQTNLTMMGVYGRNARMWRWCLAK